MTQIDVSNIENRFANLREELDTKVWNSAKSLIEIAKSYNESDPALARRILQRAKNLEPDNPEVLTGLRRLSKKVSLLKKDQMNSSSSEGGHQKRDSKLKLASALWNEKVPVGVKQKLQQPIFIFVILPFLLFAFYQNIWASPRFESRTQLIVQQPDGMATMDASMAILSGLGMGSPTSNDLELVKKYIYSQDMINFVTNELDFVEHYSSSNVDFFSRLTSNASQEDIFNYYSKHIVVEIDEKSAIISIFAQAYNSQFAFELNSVLVEKAEWYINSIGHQLANSQLEFIRKEDQVVENKMEVAKSNLLNFQQKYNLLDPVAEGAAVQQIAYGLEGQIATLEVELKNYLSVMTPQAPQVVALEAKIYAMKSQLELERNRLSVQQTESVNLDANYLSSSSTETYDSVSEVLAKYTEYKVALELAIQGYTSSQISLEKARIEAYRQLKYLIIVEAPTQPEDNQYPKVIYNLILFLVVSLMIFGISKIIIATVKELN